MTDHSKLEHRRKRIPFFSLEEVYRESRPAHYSVFLLMLTIVLWILRRFSIYETLKRVIFRDHEMPAWFLEVYLTAVWVLTVAVATNWDMRGSVIWIVLISLTILQVLQSSVYHELWRPARLKAAGQPINVSYSRLRNLIVSICNYAFVTALYGLLYWSVSDGGFSAGAFRNKIDAIYFSFTIAWSSGSLAIAPADVSHLVQIIVIAQILSTLLLITVIVGVSLGAIRTTSERDANTL